MLNKLKKIEKDLPDCFAWMANAMKAGLSLPQALHLTASEISSPLKEELQAILARVEMGETLEESLLKGERRLSLPDFSLMVQSIILLRQVGGNLVEHFENLAEILRERQKVSEKIQTLISQGRLQGHILSLLPLLLGLVLYFLSPDYLAPLWETRLGWGVLALVFILDFGGWLWIQKFSKIEI